jgi:hypothetical protein
MKVGSTAGVISGLSPGTEKAGEDFYTTYVPNGTVGTIRLLLLLLLSSSSSSSLVTGFLSSLVLLPLSQW